MQTNPESAAVEAVAWQARINEGHEWQSISEEAYKSITGWDKRALYPQSALDALRGEVAAAERRVAELEGLLTRLRYVVACLPQDAMGIAGDGDSERGDCSWPVRDEVLHNIDSALTKESQ